MSESVRTGGLMRGLKWSVALCLLALVTAEVGLRVLAWKDVRDAGQPTVDIEERLLLFLGDSVTAGLGVGADGAFPQHVVERLQGSGFDSFQMLNRARPGWDVERVVEDALPLVEGLQDNARPLLFVMIGHNDINMWNGWKPEGWEEVHGVLEGDAPLLRKKSELLVVRMARWMMAGLEDPEVAADPYFEQRLAGWVEKLHAVVEAKGGEVVLLTYPLAGAAPGDMDERRAAVLEVTRELQRLCNVSIRNVAMARGWRLIDIEKAVESPSEWNSDWFLDHTHPTAAHHALIAESIVEAL